MYSDDSEKIKQVLEKINQLEEITEKIEKFSIWPFNIVSLRNFIGLVSAPLITSFLSFVPDLVLPLFKK